MFLYHRNNSCRLQNIHHISHLHNYFGKEVLLVVSPDSLDLSNSPDFPYFSDLLDLPDSPNFFSLFVLFVGLLVSLDLWVDCHPGLWG
jgi:hypothetical protein